MEKSLEQRLVGSVVAEKYRVRRVLGTGAMGVVCEAQHLDIGKRLALKLIDASNAGDDTAARFHQEARAASRIESHHVVQVFDAGADPDLGLYLVMEYLVGEDLAHLLRRERRLDPDRAVRIAVQAARGLARAHEAGVVHRDLKPANVFLCERDEDEPLVKILDFGISKILDEARGGSRLGLTRAGTVVGTPQYMSPEQAKGEPVDERTDVWSLGLVLYEMLAGRPAYPELPSYEQFIVNLVQNAPDPLRLVAPSVPAPLAEVVHEAVEHELSDRIPSAFELARRLLEAHPVDGLRSAVVPAAADTWADPHAMSPYAQRKAAPSEPDDFAAGVRSPPGLADDPPPASQTLVSGETPSVPSIEIEVEMPPESFRSMRGLPAIVRSGVREHEPAQVVPEADDVPELFDRRAIQRALSQPPPPLAPASQTPPPASQTPPPASQTPPPQPPSSQARRGELAQGGSFGGWSLRLVALALAGVAVVVAAIVLALR